MSTVKKQSRGLTRRSIFAAGAAVPLVGILRRPAFAAEFEYKLATGPGPDPPGQPRAQEALNRIREATGGRLDIKLFPANQLGSDTDLLAQVRNGSVEFFNLSTSILSTLRAGRRHAQYRLRLQGLRCGLEGDGRRSRHLHSRADREDADHDRVARLGQRLPPHHVLDARDQDAGRSQGLQDPRPAGADADLPVQGPRRRPGPDQLQRAVLGAADEGRRGAGESARRSSPRHGSTRCRNPAASPVMSGTATGSSATSAPSSACRRTCRRSSRREFDRSAADQRADVAKLSVSLRAGSRPRRASSSSKSIAKPSARRSRRRRFYKDWKTKYGDEAWSHLEKSPASWRKHPWPIVERLASDRDGPAPVAASLGGLDRSRPRPPRGDPGGGARRRRDRRPPRRRHQPLRASTSRSSGRTSSPRSSSCGSPCSAPSSPSAAASTCA